MSGLVVSVASVVLCDHTAAMVLLDAVDCLVALSPAARADARKLHVVTGRRSSDGGQMLSSRLEWRREREGKCETDQTDARASLGPDGSSTECS